MQTQWNPNDETVQEAMKRLSDAVNAYEKKFGPHSLERVIMGDPLHPNIDDLNDSAEELENAVKNDFPLEQIPEEMWNNLIF